MKFLLSNAFTKLEFLVVVCLLCVLSIILLNRINNWHSVVERKHILGVTSNIQSALNMKTAQLALENKLDQLPALATTNPLQLLAKKPVNYHGELTDDAVKTQTKGIWYFNPKSRLLVYTLEYNTHSATHSSSPPLSEDQNLDQLRYKLKFSFIDNNKNRRFDVGIDSVSGLQLISITNSK